MSPARFRQEHSFGRRPARIRLARHPHAKHALPLQVTPQSVANPLSLIYRPRAGEQQAGWLASWLLGWPDKLDERAGGRTDGRAHFGRAQKAPVPTLSWANSERRTLSGAGPALPAAVMFEFKMITNSSDADHELESGRSGAPNETRRRDDKASQSGDEGPATIKVQFVVGGGANSELASAVSRRRDKATWRATDNKLATGGPIGARSLSSLSLSLSSLSQLLLLLLRAARQTFNASDGRPAHFGAGSKLELAFRSGRHLHAGWSLAAARLAPRL